MSRLFEVFKFDELYRLSAKCKCGTQITFDLVEDPKFSGTCPGCNMTIEGLADIVKAFRDAKRTAAQAKLDLSFPIEVRKDN